MASMYITEYARLGVDSRAGVPAAECPPVASQKVTTSGTTAQSAAFNANTKIIRVHVDAITSIEVGGTNPTATTGSARLAADQTEYFVVKAGDKIAGITNT
jgi:DUF917 family protein